MVPSWAAAVRIAGERGEVPSFFLFFRMPKLPLFSSLQFDYPGDEDLYFVASGSSLPSSVSIEASTLLQGVGLLFFLLMLRTY